MLTFRSVLTVVALTCAAMTLHALGPLDQDAGATKTIKDGVFSERQVERGEQTFLDNCEACHQPDQFVGAAYMDGWTGQSLGDFVGFIQDTMPEDNPGGLRRSQYVSVVAYFLSLNGMPTGEDNLDDSEDVLNAIMIEGPYSSH